MEYDEVSDFPEVCDELLSVDAWRLLDYGRFVRDEDMLSLETRSALRAVQSAFARHRNVRILHLLDNLALVLLLTKGRTRSFPVLAVIRRIHGIAYCANCDFVFRWVPSEVNYSDRRSRFYDAEYDPSKCVLNRLRVLQQQSMSSLSSCQRITMSSHTNTSREFNRRGQCSRNTSISCATCHSNACFLCGSGLCSGRLQFRVRCRFFW